MVACPRGIPAGGLPGPIRPADCPASATEAIAAAHALARRFGRDAIPSDPDRSAPVPALRDFAASGLWAVTVPRELGGPGLSYAVIARIIAILSAADPLLSRSVHHHLRVVHALTASFDTARRRRLLSLVLDGLRFGPPEGRFGTDLVRDGGSFLAIGAAQRGGLRVPVQDLVEVRRLEADLRPDAPLGRLLRVAMEAGLARSALDDMIALGQGRPGPLPVPDPERRSGDACAMAAIGRLAVQLEAAEVVLERAAHAVDHAVAEPSARKVRAASIAVSAAKILTAEIMRRTNDHRLAHRRPPVRDGAGTGRDPVRWKFHAIGQALIDGIAPQRLVWI